MVKPFESRKNKRDDHEYNKFVGKWFTDINPSLHNLFILNGWQAMHEENRWYSELFSNLINTYAYDIRGQGESPQNGRLDAVDNAIDADFIIRRELEKIKNLADIADIKLGNTVIQGNCIGTMTIATLFAGNFDLHKQVDGVILFSPVTSFDLPWYIKITYFLPKWIGTFSIKYIGPMVLQQVSPTEEGEYSRNNAWDRLERMDHDAALRQIKSIFWKENVKEYWKYVKIPALIIVGKNDPLVSYEDSIDPYNRLPYPIWYEFEAPDHLLLESNVELVKTIIPEFISNPWAFYEKNKNLRPSSS